jgi:mannose-1-phosphate guanylyltransferase
MEAHIVIMAGGVGSRLWPVSTPDCPKQFIDLLGTGRSLLQMTYDRFLPLASPERIWVVTSERYAGTVAEQLPSIPKEHILGEPVGRNTAPCIAYVSWKIRSWYPDAVIAVTPADAVIHNPQDFRPLIASALRFAGEGERIVTVGIKPDRPSTGYGYVHSVEAAPGKIAKVLSFKEKPSLETATEYLSSGGYYWNAGIFVWSVGTIVSEMRRFAPGIASLMDGLSPALWTDREQEVLRDVFPRCESISIDYAVMEKSSDIYLVTGEVCWSDLGGWTSLRDNIGTDADGNAVVGRGVSLYDCKGCVVHSDGSAPLVVQGLEDYVVAVREGRTLICALDKEQNIRQYSAGC